MANLAYLEGSAEHSMSDIYFDGDGDMYTWSNLSGGYRPIANIRNLGFSMEELAGLDGIEELDGTLGFKFKMPKFKMPKMPKFKAPKMPKFKAPKMPKFKAPKMPKFKAPKMPKFKAPKMPNFKAPNLKMPNLKMPNLKLPNFKMPDLSSLNPGGGENETEEPEEDFEDDLDDEFDELLDEDEEESEGGEEQESGEESEGEEEQEEVQTEASSTQEETAMTDTEEQETLGCVFDAQGTPHRYSPINGRFVPMGEELGFVDMITSSLNKVVDTAANAYGVYSKIQQQPAMQQAAAAQAAARKRKDQANQRKMKLLMKMIKKQKAEPAAKKTAAAARNETAQPGDPGFNSQVNDIINTTFPKPSPTATDTSSRNTDAKKDITKYLVIGGGVILLFVVMGSKKEKGR